MARNIIFESLTTDIIKSGSIWQGYLSINDNKNINNDLVNAIINNDNILVSVVYEDNSEDELLITNKEVDTENALKSFNYEFDEGYIRTDNITNVAFSTSSELTPIKFVFYIEEEENASQTPSIRLGNTRSSSDISKIKINSAVYNIKDAAARTELLNKQDTLVSGTNIKTINNTSLLGSGNIDIQGGGSSYIAGDGIDILTSSEGEVISNIAGMYLGDDTAPGTNLIDADLLGGNSASSFQLKLTAGTGITITGANNTIAAERNATNTYTKTEVDDLLLKKITDTTSTSATIASMATNRLYVYTQPLTALTITAVQEGPTGIIFKSGATATNVTLPVTVVKPDGYEIKANKTYEFNIMNNLLVMGEW